MKLLVQARLEHKMAAGRWRMPSQAAVRKHFYGFNYICS